MLSAYGTDKGCLTGFPTITDAVPEGVVWIDMVEPTFDEEKVVEASLKIDIPTREELAEIEASSRLYQEDGAAFMTANLIRRGENDRPESSPVTFIIKGNQLVTIRYHHPQAFPVYVHRAMKPQSTAMTGWGIFVSLLEAVVDRAADHLERVGLIVDETSRKTFSNSRTTSGRESPQEAAQSVRSSGKYRRRGRLQFQDARKPGVHRAHGGLHAGHRRPDAPDQGHEGQPRPHQGSATRHSVSHRSLDVPAGKISFLLDAVLGMSTIEQNGIIKIFSVAAVVFLPPTLVASIYGMNFVFMPELAMAGWLSHCPWH